MLACGIGTFPGQRDEMSYGKARLDKIEKGTPLFWKLSQGFGPLFS